MAKADPEQKAVEALAKALGDPAPKPLLGTRAKPGIFLGSAQSTKAAAQLAVERGWIEPIDEFVGKGRSRKQLHRITPDGVRVALERGETAMLLREMTDAVQQQEGRMSQMQQQLGGVTQLLNEHRNVLQQLHRRLVPPDLDKLLESVSTVETRSTSTTETAPATADGWSVDAMGFLREYCQRRRYAHCSLPELYHKVAEPRGVTVGQFHDGIRQLAKDKSVRLHPFTGAAYQLKEEQYALLAGQEIKYYVEPLD